MKMGIALAVTKANAVDDPDGWVWSMPIKEQMSMDANYASECNDYSETVLAMWAGPTVGAGRWLMREQSAWTR